MTERKRNQSSQTKKGMQCPNRRKGHNSMTKKGASSPNKTTKNRNG